LEELKGRLVRLALENAAQHGGKALLDPVVRRIAGELPELRPRLREILPLVKEILSEVNGLTPEEQLRRLEELGGRERAERKRREGLPELPEVEKYERVVTRFAPNPNGPLHLGHVRAALLSHEYARLHGGRFILRFEDTNPANAREEMYGRIKEDLEWLGIRWDEEFFQSDRLELYYRVAGLLLEEGKAYVCLCRAEEFREKRDRGLPCPCRELPPSQQLERWRGMREGEYGEEEAVLRVRTDLHHPNPAVRDWPAFRVVEAPHPRVGRRYRAWPLYNFSVSVDDHEMGITHVIRGKEHEVNEARQRTLFSLLGWEYPTVVQYGRLTLAGARLSKTEIVRGVERGELQGYDDVRLGTISALRRRGFLPESLRRVILEVGLTPVDSSLSWESLEAHNRKLVDGLALRYFFVPSGVWMRVRGAPELREVELSLHPSHPERGKRHLPLRYEEGSLLVLVPSSDLQGLREGEVFRLKDLMNVALISRSPPEAEFRGLELLPEVAKVQWVSGDPVEVRVLRPDGSVEEGLGEPELRGVRPGELLQFERYGFVRVEETGRKISVVFAHR
jgi:glutamyl-tRNA synthetase